MTSQFLEFNPKSFFLPIQSPEEFKAYCKRFYLFKEQTKQGETGSAFPKVARTYSNSGDLCRSPVFQSPDVLGQGSTNL